MNGWYQVGRGIGRRIRGELTEEQKKELERRGMLSAKQVEAGVAPAYYPEDMLAGEQLNMPRQGEVSGSNISVNMPKRVTPQGAAVEDYYGREALPGLAEAGKMARTKAAIEQETKVQNLLDKNQARKFKALDNIRKTQDWYAKLIKDNKLNPEIQRSMLEQVNDATKMFLGEDAELYTVADDKAEMQRKWQMNLINSFEKNEWAEFSKDPLNNRAYGRASAALSVIGRSGVPVETYRMSMNKLRTERQKEMEKSTASTAAARTTRDLYAEYAKDAKQKNQTPLSYWDWWRKLYKPLSFEAQIASQIGTAGGVDPQGFFGNQ